MGDVLELKLTPYRELWEDADTPEANDIFILEEGLELLAAYRAIADRGLRKRILELVRDAVNL